MVREETVVVGWQHQRGVYIGGCPDGPHVNQSQVHVIEERVGSVIQEEGEMYRYVTKVLLCLMGKCLRLTSGVNHAES